MNNARSLRGGPRLGRWSLPMRTCLTHHRCGTAPRDSFRCGRCVATACSRKCLSFMYGRRLVCWRRRRIHVAAASRILDAPHGAKADYTVGLQDYGSVHKASSTGEGKNCTWVGGVFHPPGDCFVTKFSLHLKLVQGEVHDEPTFGSTASFDASPPPTLGFCFVRRWGGRGCTHMLNP